MPPRVTPEATVNVPVPVMEPEKLLAAALVRVIDPAPMATVPEPESAPMVSLVPFRSRVAPAATLTVALSAIALPPDSRRVPAETVVVVVPVTVLVPDRVTVPAPALVRPPVPVMGPERVASAVAVMVASLDSVIALSTVVAPVIRQPAAVQDQPAGPEIAVGRHRQGAAGDGGGAAVAVGAGERQRAGAGLGQAVGAGDDAGEGGVGGRGDGGVAGERDARCRWWWRR